MTDQPNDRTSVIVICDCQQPPVPIASFAWQGYVNGPGGWAPQQMDGAAGRLVKTLTGSNPLSRSGTRALDFLRLNEQQPDMRHRFRMQCRFCGSNFERNEQDVARIIDGLSRAGRAWVTLAALVKDSSG